MKNIVLLGGNGYIGRNFTEAWLQRDKDVMFYVISRSGNNKLESERIMNLRADVSDFEAVQAILPEKIDYIIDFVGRPESDPQELIRVNKLPAEVMLQIAEKYDVNNLGFIGGISGPKSFVNIKAQIIKMLESSGRKVSYVQPTVVYGNGRKDLMTKMVPLLKFFGIFSKGLRPVHIDDVTSELLDKIKA